MKAIVVHEFGEPDVMKLDEVPTPPPTEAQVLVRIKAAGVNPVDTYLRSGNHAHAPKLPYIPGKDGAGIVEAVGPDVKKFRPGDRVYTADTLTGTYAEFALCEETQLGRLPDNVSFEAGAGVWTPYATAYRALFQKAHAKGDEKVLIHGASGGVGIAGVQWSKKAGITVIGSASSPEGKQLVAEQGADLVVDHLDDNHLAEVKKFTGGTGVNVIIEILANVNLQKDFDVLVMFGRITVVGNRGSLEFNPRAAMTRDATIYGMSLFNAPQSDRDQIHTAIFEGLSKGFLSPVVRESIPLSDAPRAHREIIDNKAFGKIVLIP
jgi:NADPH2:quinone reductase